ncbi:MAG: DinB family protein [Acidobacteria bacterium]|nr:DinB family protein [Acidobacteriota bacterium]
MGLETGSPRTGGEIIAALSRLQSQSEELVDALGLEVFFAPQGSHWSPRDHVRHLTKSVRPVARALGLPKPALFVLFGPALRPSRPFDEMVTVYRAKLAAGATAGRFTPSTQEVPPVESEREAARAKVCASWRETAHGLAAAAAKWDERALDRYRLPHPLLGKLTVREMLFFTLYHNAHHLRIVDERSRGARID